MTHLPDSSPRPRSGCDLEMSRAVLDAIPDALFLIDPTAGNCRPVNAAAVQWMADSSASPSGSVPIDQCFPDLDVASFAGAKHGWHITRLRRANSVAVHDVQIQLRRLKDDIAPSTDARWEWLALLRPVGSSSAVSKSLPRDALDDAFHDPLTRLPNRRLFARRLERAIHKAATSNYHFAVLFVDLDGFKSVNDRFGHLLGDRLLMAAAHRLVEAVRPQDMVARRDGDEFTVLLDDLDRPEDAMCVAERMIEHLQRPLQIDRGEETIELTITASIGVASIDDRTLGADDLLAQADAAMYQAKALGGGTFAGRQSA